MLPVIHPDSYREIRTLEKWREDAQSHILQNIINIMEKRDEYEIDDSMSVVCFDVCAGLARQVINERLAEFYGI